MTDYADLVERLRFLHEKTEFAAFAEAAEAIEALLTENKKLREALDGKPEMTDAASHGKGYV